MNGKISKLIFLVLVLIAVSGCATEEKIQMLPATGSSENTGLGAGFIMRMPEKFREMSGVSETEEPAVYIEVKYPDGKVNPLGWFAKSEREARVMVAAYPVACHSCELYGPYLFKLVGYVHNSGTEVMQPLACGTTSVYLSRNGPNEFDVTFRSNSAPTIVFNPPSGTFIAGQTINFQASAADTHDEIFTPASRLFYAWDFNGESLKTGYGDSGRNVSHVFSRPGTKTITVVVSDEIGASARVSRTIEVLSGSAKPAWHPSSDMPAARYGHQVIEFQNALYLIGGHDGSQTQSCVWKSLDGVNWTGPLSCTGGPPARFGHRCVVYNDTLYLIAGASAAEGSTMFYNDYYFTRDGINWSTGAAPFPPRSSHCAFVHDGKIIVACGGAQQLYSDVWAFDGTTWRQLTAAAGFSPRDGAAGYSDGTCMLIAGGNTSSGPVSEIACSTNGVNWTVMDGGFPARHRHSIAFYNGYFRLAGGYDSSGRYLNDNYVSSDGRFFILATDIAESYSPRRAAALVSFGGKLWLYGGYDGTVLKSVWVLY